MENPTPNQHPVLAQLNERIAELTNETETNKATIKDLHQRLQLKAKEVFDKETYLNETLMNAIENGYDRETIFYIANELDVELVQRKTYTVQVEFEVEVKLPLDEEFDASDVDYSLYHEHIEDYTFTGVISSDEN
jgi:Spy/CpxP family protein refolding chaperone